MDYTPITPFRRTIDRDLLAHQAAGEEDLPLTGANKWEVLRELAAGRTAFELTDRDLTVLQALVSFHPATILGGNDPALIVHPSNKSICERLNGMPCSTMRRHLSKLVAAGIVLRRDSPNGKRYVKRYGAGDPTTFGFDLSPLVRRFPEFCAAAEAVRAAEERHKRLRTSVSLMRRDLAGLTEYGRTLRPDTNIWDRFDDLALLTARDLRRKLDLRDLAGLEIRLREALDEARDLCEPLDSIIMNSNDAISEQQYQNSKKDYNGFKPCFDKARKTGAGRNKYLQAHEASADSGKHDRTGIDIARNDVPPQKTDGTSTLSAANGADRCGPSADACSSTVSARRAPKPETTALSYKVSCETRRSSKMVPVETTKAKERADTQDTAALTTLEGTPTAGSTSETNGPLASARGVRVGQNDLDIDDEALGAPTPPLPSIPLGLVLTACTEILTYAEQPVRHWHDLVRLAERVRPMMGISPSAWEDAKHHMGPEQAAVVVAALLERFGEIYSPGGYLRSLTAKAAAGAFSCGPMIMALMRKDAA